MESAAEEAEEERSSLKSKVKEALTSGVEVNLQHFCDFTLKHT